MNPKVLIFVVLILVLSGFFIFKSHASEIPLPFIQDLTTSSTINLPQLTQSSRISALQAYQLLVPHLADWDPNAQLIQVRPSDVRAASERDFTVVDGLSSEWLFYFVSADNHQSARYKVTTPTRRLEISTGDLSRPDYVTDINPNDWKLDSNRLYSILTNAGFSQWLSVHPGFDLSSALLKLEANFKEGSFWRFTAKHATAEFQLLISTVDGQVVSAKP